VRVRSFRVRQLAAAFPPASLLAGNVAPGRNSREQARGEESGSKLPHSKALHPQLFIHQSPITNSLKSAEPEPKELIRPQGQEIGQVTHARKRITAKHLNGDRPFEPAKIEF